MMEDLFSFFLDAALETMKPGRLHHPTQEENNWAIVTLSRMVNSDYFVRKQNLASMHFPKLSSNIPSRILNIRPGDTGFSRRNHLQDGTGHQNESPRKKNSLPDIYGGLLV